MNDESCYLRLFVISCVLCCIWREIESIDSIKVSDEGNNFVTEEKDERFNNKCSDKKRSSSFTDEKSNS